jgi:hypothetical protein
MCVGVDGVASVLEMAGRFEGVSTLRVSAEQGVRSADMRNRSHWLWAGLTLAVVLGGAGAAWWATRPAALMSPSTAPAATLVAGDYYLFVKLIELTPLRPDGKHWDTRAGDAPDVRFEIFWQGARVFEGTERDDTLIAHWDLFRVDLKDTIANGGKLDVAGSINAPIVRVGDGGTLEVAVWDDDPVGSDLAGTIRLETDRLKPGENELGPVDGVRRMIVMLIDRKTPLPELIEMQSKR